jgi:hypothetical protein
VTGVLLAVIAVILVVGAAVAVAAVLRLQDLLRFVLGAYVLGFAEVVGLLLLLSAFGAVTRPAILVGLGWLFAASVATWLLLGAPRLPHTRLKGVRALQACPILLVLGAGVALAYGYVLALIVGTPPNNWDALSYHLARAAFWRQEGAIGYVADTYDERLNVNPPNAEIVLTFMLEVGRNEHLAGFVQFTAALVVAVGVYSLAQKLGLGRREAALGAFLVLTLPIVLLQASTAQNDLVAASFLVVATVFVLGDSRRELTLAALATALAVGTKVPAVYGLAVLAAVALVAPPRAFVGHRIVAIVAGASIGSYWYIVNVVETERPLGDLPNTSGLAAFLEPTENLLAAYARLLDAFDLSGSVRNDLYVYAIVAASVAVVLILRARDERGRELVPALATGALILAPFLVLLMSYLLWRAFAKLHDVLDEPDGALPVRGWEAQTPASDSLSWFGPGGLLLIVGVGVGTVVLVRRGSLPRLALVFAAAPLAFFVLLALSVGYDEWQGRFFVYPVALSASLWGLVLRVDRYAVAAVAIALTTAALSLVHFTEKPSGLRLFETAIPSSIWGVERWQAESTVHKDMGPVLRFLEDEVGSDSVIALALSEDDFGFPAFGPRLERSVELVPVGSSALRSRAEWLLANPNRAQEITRRCWRAVFTTPGGWAAFRRRDEACAT